MPRSRWSYHNFTLLVALTGIFCQAFPSNGQTITVTGSRAVERYVICHAVVKGKRGVAPTAVECGGLTLPAQSQRVAKGFEIIFVIPELKSAETKTFTTKYASNRMSIKPAVFVIQHETSGVDIQVNGHPFTTYDTKTGPNKPYFNPIFAPGDALITRKYPFENVVGESHDHPHHRGLWFTHGSVNGEDYWSEVGIKAKTVNTGVSALVSGAVYGRFVASTDWINGAGMKIGSDTRTVTVFPAGTDIIMDFEEAFKAGDQPVVFGDTKEGSFGIRLADSMRIVGGDGHIVMSTGVKDGATWGKRAEWVDYYGSVGGKTVGVAILDNPGNLRFPTTWHVRDYGLFANNPFGLHDFNNDKKNPHLGDFTLEAGKIQMFKYRLLFHSGDTSAARIAELWNGYASPASVKVVE
ncbi:MAG: PmoA family protein [Chthonomonadales bacterium]